jgi:hypothetical protein
LFIVAIMRVLSIFTVLATAVAVYAQTATIIVGQFQSITTLVGSLFLLFSMSHTPQSSNLNDVTASLNILNALFKGPQVGQGKHPLVFQLA